MKRTRKRRWPSLVLVCLAVLIWGGMFHTNEAAAVWSMDPNITPGFDTWLWDGSQKFRYDTGLTQWQHYSTVGTTWYNLSTTGLSATFVGNGSVYNIGNGLKYRYDVNSNYGFFYDANPSQYRFFYNYTPGTWYTTGYAGGWYKLGATGTSASVIGDGAWHDVGIGLNYRYDELADTSFYQKGTVDRFRYQHITGQWDSSGAGGGWYALGAAGRNATTVPDGGIYDLGVSVLRYRYDAARDLGFFYRAGSGYRYYYNYTTGQWYNSGFGGGWFALGASGRNSSLFVDGNYHDLGNGLWYRYLVASDDVYASFDGTSVGDRFYYLSARGQWQHRGAMGGWFNLGTAGRSGKFIGDGTEHDLGNGFLYTFVADQGTWTKNGAQRFLYDYGLGQWSDKGASGNWELLGPQNTLSQFMGDGTQYDLGNGFFYSYVGDQGYWTRGGAQRFMYDYAGGQWNSMGGVGGWNTLGASLQSAKFAGDGDPFDLLNGFSFVYTYLTDQGSFFQGATERFRYLYGAGLGTWTHYCLYGGWQPLASGLNSAFVGDGSPYALGTGWTYSYDELTSMGYWLKDSLGFTKFSFDYVGGQWYDYDKFANQYALGPLDNSLAEFMGDGNLHALDGTWSYMFDGASGQWWTAGAAKFQYAYGSGVWSHYGNVGADFAISAANRTGQFIGTYTGGAPLDLGNGFSYWFDGLGNTGHWLNTVGGASRFDYAYGDGSWWHYGNVGGIYALSGAGRTGQFLGDYTSATPLDLGLGNGFSYWYDGVANIGHWLTGTPTPTARFDYSYGDGSWSHYGPVGGVFALSGTGNDAKFIGDYTDIAALDLANGFSYWYAGGVGHWQIDVVGTTYLRFDYNYADGQWLDAGNTGGSWALSAVEQSAEFVGDGAPHLLGNGFSYYYMGDTGYWKVEGAATDRFEYVYGDGVWSHYDYIGTPSPLTGLGASAQFWGDGHLAQYDLTFWYHYDAGLDRGYYALAGGVDRFGYNYGSGQWGDVTDVRAWKELGLAGQTLAFIGDGTPYNLGMGGSFAYTYLPDPVTDHGSFYFDATHQFRQAYTTGAWEYFHGNPGTWSAWSGVTTPPDTFAGLSAYPNNAYYYFGAISGGVWFIPGQGNTAATAIAYAWNGTSFQLLTSGYTFSYLMGYQIGDGVYFKGGRQGTTYGYDLFYWDGTTFTNVTGNGYFGQIDPITVNGIYYPYFKVSAGSFGGVAHTGWDLAGFVGGVFTNLSNASLVGLTHVGSAGSEWFFSGQTGTWPNYRYDVYSFDYSTAAWNNLSNALYTAAPTWLAGLGSEAFFSYGGHLYSWNQTDWAIRSGATTYGSVSYLTTVGDALFLKIQGGTGTWYDLASYSNATGWNELSNSEWTSNVIFLTAVGSTYDTVRLYFDGQSSATHNVNSWDLANGTVQRSDAAGGMNFTNIAYLGTAGGDLFFNCYGGTIGGVNHSGYDLFVWDDNTTWRTGSTFGVTPTFLTALGTDGLFSINGGTGHSLYDLFRWSGSSLINTSNMSASGLTFVKAIGADAYLLVTGGTLGGVAHSGTDLFRWNGTWSNVSNVGGTMSYLTSLGTDLLFSVTGGTVGGTPHTGTDLFRWDGGTFGDISGNKGFSSVFTLGQIVDTAVFFVGTDTLGRHVYRWNGTAFEWMSDNAPQSSVAGPTTVWNGDFYWFQVGYKGGPTSGWYLGLLWNSYFDVLNNRI